MEMKNLFVGNLSFQTTEGDLRNMFATFGQVSRVHIATDRETGQARGFAFVEMANDAEATKAMTDLNGKEINGRALRVNEATPRPERGAPGAGGRPSFNRSSGGPGAGRSGPGAGRNGPPRGNSGGGNRGGGGGQSRERFSNEDYREAPRQPREPRW
jgi:cold-inducible RNA-binding protein